MDKISDKMPVLTAKSVENDDSMTSNEVDNVNLKLPIDTVSERLELLRKSLDEKNKTLDNKDNEIDKEKQINAVSITDKVRFWEQQDRINGVLIPRVIRQNELLAKHIAEHDDLPKLFSSSIAKSLAKQSSQFKSELNDAKITLNKVLAKTLNRAISEHAQQARQELEACLSQLDEHHSRLRSEQEKRIEAAIASLHEEWNRSRNHLTVIAIAAVIVAVASVVLILL